MLSDMETSIYEKLLSILEFVLSRLGRYDEGNPIGALLSMAPKPNSIFNKVKNLVGDQSNAPPTQNNNSHAAGQVSFEYLILTFKFIQKGNANQQQTAHLGHSYVTFLRGSSEQLRQVVTDEVWVNDLFERWYDGQMKMINDWLIERLQQSLSSYQLTCLSFIVKKIYSDFELQGIEEERLNNKNYNSIMKRIQLEETNCALNDNVSSSHGSSSNPLLGNATSAVSNVSSMVEGAGAKVFSLFK